MLGRKHDSDTTSVDTRDRVHDDAAHDTRHMPGQRHDIDRTDDTQVVSRDETAAVDPEQARRDRFGGINWGAGFFGWQVQPGVRTVQAELEAALSRLRNSPTTVIAAGRTDRGVHATGQVVSALMPAKWSAAAVPTGPPS